MSDGLDPEIAALLSQSDSGASAGNTAGDTTDSVSFDSPSSTDSTGFSASVFSGFASTGFSASVFSGFAYTGFSAAEFTMLPAAAMPAAAAVPAAAPTAAAVTASAVAAPAPTFIAALLFISV